MMDIQVQHEMMPRRSHDQQAQQLFIRDLRRHLALHTAPGCRRVFDVVEEPRFEKQHGRKPEDQQEVRALMTANDYYQFWSATQRASQEMMWDSVIDSIEDDWDRLQDSYQRLSTANTRKGSLRLAPDLPIPSYHTAADIHQQPGGYHTDFRPDDVAAGALYDRALYIYLMGGAGPKNDALGQLLLHHVKQAYPDFRPKRILDMGCTQGGSAGAWAEAFPEAEVHAIDVGAPVLRYGHARAEALGIPIHFSQQNAEATDFPDGHFDLVLSHIMLHETSRKALPRIIAESWRLLAPGGMMLHFDIPKGATPFDKFMFEWETYNNNEMFAGTVRKLDLPRLSVAEAGLPEGVAEEQYCGSSMSDDQRNYTDANRGFPVLAARKPA